MPTILATIKNIQVIQEDDDRVHWQSAAAVDADGANGQNGNPFAYRYPILPTTDWMIFMARPNTQMAVGMISW
jgi:hypothetical protein